VKGKGNEKSRSPRSYHPKFILAAVWKGNLEGKMDWKNWNPKFIMAGFEWKTVKGKGHEKSRNQTLKGTWHEKSRNLRSYQS
jgi:hypothetical protein